METLPKTCIHCIFSVVTKWEKWNLVKKLKRYVFSHEKERELALLVPRLWSGWNCLFCFWTTKGGMFIMKIPKHFPTQCKKRSSYSAFMFSMWLQFSTNLTEFWYTGQLNARDIKLSSIFNYVEYFWFLDFFFKFYRNSDYFTKITTDFHESCWIFKYELIKGSRY